MRNTLWGVILWLLGGLVVACGEADSASNNNRTGSGPVIVQELPLPPQPFKPAPTGPTYALDDALRLNEIQMKGSHNSYHLWVDNGEPEWAYDVPSIPVQLEYQGVRAFELDVHYVDGRFGVFQVLGYPDRSSCPWLEDCLQQIRTWSEANPGHAPLVIYFEARDTATATFYDHVEAFETTLAAHWPRERSYTPDDLMGGEFNDVTSAMQAKGWPTLGKVRGKVIMVLHDFGAARYRYTRDNGLHGRRMFVTAVNMQYPNAGFLALDEPVENEATIKDFVARGYMVRTRSDDLPTQGGNRWVKRDAAIISGAQLVLTDYPEGNYIPGYYVEMPGGKPVRCNPITAPRAPGACTAEEIENPALLRTWGLR